MADVSYQPDEDIRAIDALLEAFESAVQKGASDMLTPLFCKGVTAFFSGLADPVRGRENLVATWQQLMSQWSGVRIKRRETLVRVHGDVAWAHFLWDGEGVVKGMRYRLGGERWTAVMLWEEGGWRLAQTHTSIPYRDWESHRVENR